MIRSITDMIRERIMDDPEYAASIKDEPEDEFPQRVAEAAPELKARFQGLLAAHRPKAQSS